MTKKFGKMLQSARKSSGLTQERAAEALHISTRTLAKYEQGETVPTDSTMAAMMRLYENNALGITYLFQKSAVYRELYAEIQQPPGPAAGVVNLHICLNEVKASYDRLEMLCADDVISRAEEAAFRSCMKPFEKLDAAITGMKIVSSPRRVEKKNRLAATRRLKVKGL